MAVQVSTPHCPFDRLWQPGHPFRPRRSRFRRWTMALLLIFMSAVVSCYWYLTDPTRIREMSQGYLSELVGGQVQVGSATLTVFEGLKLSKISVKVDKAGPADDRELFFADAIEIRYNPASLLRGRLDATRIIATGAKAKLVEDGGRWNYQRLLALRAKGPHRPDDKKPLQLPQLVLRDANVEYSEVQGDRCVPRGSVDIEGSLYPSANGSLYSFALQSRGQSQGVGPAVSGQVTLKTGAVVAALSHLRFDQDLETMLPSQVRDFWQAHQVEGAVEIPEFRFTPATASHRATFNVQTQLQHVKLVVRAEEFDPPPQYSLPTTRPTALAWLPLEKINLFSREFRRTVRWMHAMPEHPPLAVDDVSGDFFFDENGIHFDRLIGTVAGATLSVSAKIDGYSPDAPIWLRVESKPGELVTIPRDADFLPALPPAVHQAYSMLQPYGSGTMWAELKRTTTVGLPDVKGEIDIVDGNFKCIFFPYPVRAASGKIRFSPDPSGTFIKMTLDNLRGSGIVGGPNEHSQACITGWVGANNPDVGCHIRAYGTGLQSEPALFAAFPPPVRKVMNIFKGPGDEKLPHFSGDFDCTVFVPPGVAMRPIVGVDLNFTDGAGRLAAFPYPFAQLKGVVNVRDGYVDLNDISMTQGASSVTVGGRVTWPVDMPPDAVVIAKPNLKVVAKNVPVDATLFKALPREASSWLTIMGATGTIEVDGKVLPKPDATLPDDSIAFDMNVGVHDGTIKPRGSEFAVGDLHGKLMVHADRLELLEVQGRRGNATLSATGSVNWSTGGADVKIDSTAAHVLLEPALRDLLPVDAKAGWKTLDPHGVMDARVIYHGTWAAMHSEPIASVDIPLNSFSPPPPVNNEFDVVLKPVDISITPSPLPYRLDHCTGEIDLTPRNITITDVHATHGRAKIAISGKGVTTDPNNWDFNLQAHDLTVDDELKKALPVTIRQTLDQLKYKGELSVDLFTFRYRGDKPDPDIDFAGTIWAAKGSADVGMTVDSIIGSMPFAAAVRNGKLAAFHGDLDINSLNMADRAVSDLKGALDMTSGSDVLHVGGIRGSLAGGEVAGNMDLKFPDAGPSSYALDFQLKNADLRDMAKQVAPKGQEIRGQLSASVALQGEWADPATRRGRGDVQVSGKEIYQIPLLLGVLDVTNLSLPTTSPFNEGSMRYLVEGNRVDFEQVQMRSDDLLMSGRGWLDFGTKQVRMNLTTENPRLPRVPLITDLWQGAKSELLQIQVRGTVQSPKVSASSMHTFTTTVDEVLHGNRQ